MALGGSLRPPADNALEGASPADETPIRSAILIVDDLPEKLLVFSTLLEDLGHELVCVRSGAEALREVLKREFAVILLDVNMPDIDGLETGRLIRSYRKSAHTPIIFITAYADELQTERGYSLGAVDYILSPVMPQVLRSKVKVFVDLHVMQQRVQRQAHASIALAAAQTARAVAEANTRRADFLLRASTVLSGSLEPDLAARQLLDLVVPELVPVAALVKLAAADAAADAESGEQRVTEVLLRYRDGARGSIPISEARRAALPAPLAAVITTALEHGVVDLDTEALPALNAMLSDLPSEDGAGGPFANFAGRLVTGLALPLATGTHAEAVLLVASDDPESCRRQPPGVVASTPIGDRSVLEELASRAAIALENARLYANLQVEIEERRRAEARMRDADRRKDEFLAMLSHELRNPLAPIRNAMELVRRLAPPDPRIELAGQMMDRQVTHMMQLVEELLDVARIGQGKITMKREAIDLSALVSHALETVKPLAETLRHSVQVTLPDTPVRLLGDFHRLTQVLGNLLNNAAKYTKEGGRIQLVAEARAGEAVISVIDNGVGIDRTLLPRVFDLFQQGSRTLDRSQGGLGIGLNVARQLVEAHNGRIEAASEGPDRGATFTVYLPCVSVVGGEVAKPDGGEQRRQARGMRVLIVEDNRDAADSVALYLGLEGHLVKTVGDGSRALEVAPVFAPQVVVLDIGLPGLNGYEAAQRLRLEASTRDALLIALTGYGQREDRERARAAGFDHHLVKPADMKVLANLIAEFSVNGVRRSIEAVESASRDR